jgi:hypothetical protein
LRRLVKLGAKTGNIPFKEVPDDFLSGEHTYPEIIDYIKNLRDSLAADTASVEVERADTDWSGEPLPEPNWDEMYFQE